MKKILKMLTVLLCIIFTSSSIGLASTTIKVDPNYNYNRAKKIALDYGMPEGLVSTIPSDELISIAKLIKEDPEKITHEKATVYVDQLKVLHYYVKSTDNDLKKDGLNDDEIKKIRENISSIKSTPDEQLISNYKLNKQQVKSMRDVLNNKVDDASINQLAALGSTLTDDFYTINYGTSSTVDYRCYYYFDWLTVPIVTAFTDSVAFAWGGNLHLGSISTSLSYYSVASQTSISGTATYTEKAVNGGGTFDFKQLKTSGGRDYAIKSGSIRFDIEQTYKNSPAVMSKALAQYAHKQFAITGGITITLGGISPSISIGTGYYQHPQRSATIYY